MVTEDRKKTNVTPIFKRSKKPSKPQVDPLQLNPNTGDRATHFGNHFQMHEGQKDDLEHGLVKGKSHLTNIQFSDQMRQSGG